MNTPDWLDILLSPDYAAIQVYNAIFIFLTLIGALAATIFSVIYFLFFPWTKNMSGRSVLGLVSSVAAILWIIVLARSLGDYPGRYLLTTIVYITVPAALIGLLVLLLSRWVRTPGPPEVRRQAVADDFEHTIPPRQIRRGRR